MSLQNIQDNISLAHRKSDLVSTFLWVTVVGLQKGIFHVICRADAELLEEALREVGGIGESDHVAHFADGVASLVEQLGRTLETDYLDHLVGGDIGQSLDLGKESAAADV